MKINVLCSKCGGLVGHTCRCERPAIVRMLAVLMMIGLFGLCACNKKEDAPAAQVPHVAGSWSGTGTDDAIGFYNLAVTLTQSNGDVAGTFATSSGFASTSGNVSIKVGPAGGNNVQSLAFARTQWSVTAPPPSRTCAGTMTMTAPTFMTSNSISFGYVITDCQGGTWTGGANLHKTAGTN